MRLLIETVINAFPAAAPVSEVVIQAAGIISLIDKFQHIARARVDQDTPNAWDVQYSNVLRETERVRGAEGSSVETSHGVCVGGKGRWDQDEEATREDGAADASFDN